MDDRIAGEAAKLATQAQELATNLKAVAQQHNLYATFMPKPIAGINGSCSAPLRTVNQGSIIPIKFDLFCGSTLITGGRPPLVKIQASTPNLPSTSSVSRVAASGMKCCSTGCSAGSTMQLPLKAPMGSVSPSGSIRNFMPMVGRLEVIVKPMPAS